MKNLLLLFTCTILCTSLFSCGKEDKQPPAPPEPPSPPYGEAPGNTSGFGESAESLLAGYGQTTPEKSPAEKAEEVKVYLSEYFDLENFAAPSVYDEETEYVMVYLLNEDVIKSRDFLNSIIIGKEEVSISLPITHTELASLGFTAADEGSFDTAVPSLDEAAVTYCTPTDKEYIGFYTYNGTSAEVCAKELSVNAVLFTALNNFSICGGLNKDATVKDISDVMGCPDSMEISVEEDNISIILQYKNQLTEGEALFFIDGTTNNLIAIKIYAE